MCRTSSVDHHLHYLPCLLRDVNLTPLCGHLQGISNVSVQSSVSLQHLPYDVKLEKKLPSEIESRLSFATQKLKEIVDAAAQAPKLKDEDIKAGLPVCELLSVCLPTVGWVHQEASICLPCSRAACVTTVAHWPNASCPSLLRAAFLPAVSAEQCSWLSGVVSLPVLHTIGKR